MAYKDNFCKNMGYFSKLSTEIGKSLPDGIPVKPLFLNAEKDWNEKSAKVAYMLGMSTALLKQSFLGKNFLNEGEVSRLISEAKLTMYDSEEKIFKEGDAARDTGICEILSGKVDVIIGGKIIATLNKGDIFGERSVIKNDKRGATVVVSEKDSVIAEIPSETFLYFYNNNGKFHSYIKDLIKARSMMNGQLEKQSEINEDKNYLPNGPFPVPGTGILYYVYEVLDNAEIDKVLQKWFSKGKNRYFEWSKWNTLIQLHVHKKVHPNGFLVKLQSKSGEILGLAFFHKVDNFMFSRDEEMQTEDIASIYFFDLMEVAEKYRIRDWEKFLWLKP